MISGVEVPAAVNHTHAGVLQDDDALRHERHAGVPFVRGEHEDASGVDPSDIRQGMIGDCFFLSPLMATARINPRRISQMCAGSGSRRRAATRTRSSSTTRAAA